MTSGKLPYRADGEKVGELEWDLRPGGVMEVHLDVDPSHQRKGIGRELIASAEQLANDYECMALTTFMAADNAKAKGFFAAVGFTLIHAPGYYGIGRDAYLGIKPLRAPR